MIREKWSIKQLIKNIETSPYDFVHEKKLRHIINLVYGSKYCATIVDRNFRENAYFTELFRDWVEKWIIDIKGEDTEEINFDWYKIIERNTISSEEAVEKFNELSSSLFLAYDEYIEELAYDRFKFEIQYLNVEELLQNLKKRPGMYVLEINISNLYYYLKGYLLCAVYVGFATESDFYFKDNFIKYVANWAGIDLDSHDKKSNLLWFEIIEQNTLSEAEALEVFYKLSEQFFSICNSYSDEFSTILDWNNPKCESTYGITFTKHGSHHQIKYSMDTARENKKQFGQWTNDQQVADFIAQIAQEKGVGTHDIPLPNKFPSRVFLPNGIQAQADMARVIVNPDGSVQTAYPFSSRHPH